MVVVMLSTSSSSHNHNHQIVPQHHNLHHQIQQQQQKQAAQAQAQNYAGGPAHHTRARPAPPPRSQHPSARLMDSAASSVQFSSGGSTVLPLTSSSGVPSAVPTTGSSREGVGGGILDNLPATMRGTGGRTARAGNRPGSRHGSVSLAQSTTMVMMVTTSEKNGPVQTTGFCVVLDFQFVVWAWWF